MNETFNFYPSELSRKEKQEKSIQLDSFAKFVLSNKSEYLPILRKELQNYKNNKFFLFDGASLLFRNTKDKNDLQICANAIAKSRLKDLQGSSYLFFTVDLGKNGIDTYGAIENILDYPKFTAFLPKHSTRLGQNFVVMYCCLQLDDDLYVDKLIERLQHEKDLTTIKTIILVLSNCVTEKTKEVIQEYSKNTKDTKLKQYISAFKYNSKDNLPDIKLSSSRKDIDKLLTAFKSRQYVMDKDLAKRIYKELPHLVNKSDYHKIKQIRRDVAYRISDEAIDELSFLTYLLKLSFTSKK